MEPGATILPHEHAADEECFMIQGEATVGDIHLSAGYYHFSAKGSKHGLVTTEAGALAFFCIV